MRREASARDAPANADAFAGEDRPQKFARQPANHDIAPPLSQRRLKATHHQHAVNRRLFEANGGGDILIEMQGVIIAGRLGVADELLKTKRTEIAAAYGLPDFGPISRREINRRIDNRRGAHGLATAATGTMRRHRLETTANLSLRRRNHCIYDHSRGLGLALELECQPIIGIGFQAGRSQSKLCASWIGRKAAPPIICASVGRTAGSVSQQNG